MTPMEVLDKPLGGVPTRHLANVYLAIHLRAKKVQYRCILQYLKASAYTLLNVHSWKSIASFYRMVINKVGLL